MTDEKLITAVRKRARADDKFCSAITTALLAEFESHGTRTEAGRAVLEQRHATVENRDRAARIAEVWKEPTERRVN